MKPRTSICALLAVALIASMITMALAQQPPFSATITITSSAGTTIEVDQTTTLTATWSTNRDVTRYEWLVDSVSQGEVSIDGASSGSSTFDFSSSTAGTFTIAFRVWHHQQTDREASNYICITVTDPAPTEYTFETAFAYSEDADNDFRDNGFERWGWSNGPLASGYSGTWELWAGAGQSDLENGVQVGTVDVFYSGGAVTVQLNLYPDIVLQESIVYAGNAMFPIGPNGKETVAPGQYTNPGGFSGDVYVIVHAVVGIPVA